MLNRRSIVIHGHFYQPPREDPWSDRVPQQPSAAPDHDWNARIARECYGPITQARLAEGDGHRAVNTLEYLSFNFGPTLLRWMERAEPQIYKRVLAADIASVARLGSGNAIAQSYHHSILPLASERDKRTELRWGILDFRRRFARQPQGIWLPETAVDGPTLDAVGEEGIEFVLLAPHQVDALPAGGMPGWYVTRGGARIALVPYDGALSHATAFGDALRDGEGWAERLASVGSGDPSVPRRLVTVATDGETYGHHHPFAEMGLAATLEHLSRRDDVVVENIASFLAHSPPTEEVGLVAPSAWSCAHGVERWRSNCGCKLDPSRPTQQAWRTPLREGLEAVARELHTIFDDEARRWLTDPWRARDAYGELLDLSDPELVLQGLRNAGLTHSNPLTSDEGGRLIDLLEMERDSLRMFTSCGWFFDDVTRIEPRQVLLYAERALRLSGVGDRLRPQLLATLATARSNDPEWDDAAEFYEARVLRPDTERTA